ncbi:MAG: helix-turn-helix domain-containing protein [Gammaproteobacteria bacterium]|nr:helix-turn-helix domain-containing protein [Gammaproteobacteria bacterium]
MTTESMDNEFEHTEAEFDTRTAGAVLQAERVNRGLSEKEVADQLHITMHYVRAIESDDYEKLPGKVFARGYIKSYALLLQLDEDELLKLYDEFLAWRSHEVRETERFSTTCKGKSRILPWLIFLVLAFIIGFLCFWAYNSFFSNEEITRTGNEVWEVYVQGANAEMEADSSSSEIVG